MKRKILSSFATEILLDERLKFENSNRPKGYLGRRVRKSHLTIFIPLLRMIRSLGYRRTRARINAEIGLTQYLGLYLLGESLFLLDLFLIVPLQKKIRINFENCGASEVAPVKKL